MASDNQCTEGQHWDNTKNQCVEDNEIKFGETPPPTEEDPQDFSGKQKKCPDGSYLDASGNCKAAGTKLSKAIAGESKYRQHLRQMAEQEQYIKEMEAGYESQLRGIDLWDDEIARRIGKAEGEPGRQRNVASRALAAAMGQSGMGSSGVGFGGSLASTSAASAIDDKAQSVVNELEGLVHDGLMSKEEAIQAAHELAADITKEKMDRLTMDDFRAGENARLNAVWERIVENNLSTYFGDGELWGDDEVAMFRAMKSELRNVEDPVLYDQWIRRACGVLSMRQGSSAQWCRNNYYPTDLEDPS